MVRASIKGSALLLSLDVAAEMPGQIWFYMAPLGITTGIRNQHQTVGHEMKLNATADGARTIPRRVKLK